MGYSLHLAHLYGDLLNTYGDIGNVLVLEYYAKQMGIEFTSEIVSIEQDFDEKKFDLAFFGGGQDFEQTIDACHLRWLSASWSILYRCSR